MKSSLAFLLLVLLILFPECWGGFCLGQSVTLTAQEDSLLTRNWKIAYQLADYDRYSWIATDSLVKYHGAPNPSEIQGWIVTSVSEPAKVVFGRLDQSCLRSSFEAVFENGTVRVNPHPNTKYCEREDPYKRFSAVSSARKAIASILDSSECPYNTYVLGSGDTLAVYFMPAATNEYYGFCGGIRTLVNTKDFSIVETKKLHRSPLLTTPPPSNYVAMMRTSSLGTVPNEVDLAQTIIFKDAVKNHMIATSKYMFSFKWDKEGRNVSTEILPLGPGQSR